MTQSGLAKFEQRGVERARMATLQRYMDRLTGWAEPIAGPTPSLSPGSERERQTLVRWDVGDFDAELFDLLWLSRCPVLSD